MKIPLFESSIKKERVEDYLNLPSRRRGESKTMCLFFLWISLIFSVRKHADIIQEWPKNTKTWLIKSCEEVFFSLYWHHSSRTSLSYLSFSTPQGIPSTGQTCAENSKPLKDDIKTKHKKAKNASITALLKPLREVIMQTKLSKI